MEIERAKIHELLRAESDAALGERPRCVRWGDVGSRYLAGGGPSSLQWTPVPVIANRARGARLTDLDGFDYADFHLGHGVMMAGHANPEITAVMRWGATRLTHTGLAAREATALARLICERFALDQVALATSGSEATALALRIARAHTGRSGLIKVEGAYHGAVDSGLMVSTHPEPAGPMEATGWGPVPRRVLEEVRVIPFNDLAAAERMIIETRPAALITEPVLLNAGLILPDDGYLQGLAELCARHGVVFILDEVKTGLAVGPGGARELFEVESDLVCLGKGLAAGLPLSVVGGRRDLMAHIADDSAPHYATFAGGPLVAEVARTCLAEVLSPEAYPRMLARAADLRTDLAALITADAPWLDAHATGIGVKGALVFAGRTPPSDYRDWAGAVDQELGMLWWLMLLRRGVLLPPGQDEQWTISVDHGPRESDAMLAAARAFIGAIRP